MTNGIVKWFNSTKGYGFIQQENGGANDVFVHITELERSGIPNLVEGQKITFEVSTQKGKTSAINLKLR